MECHSCGASIGGNELNCPYCNGAVQRVQPVNNGAAGAVQTSQHNGPAIPPYQPTLTASNKIPAGICAIFFGCLGVHKFILGYKNEALTMLSQLSNQRGPPQ